MQFIITIISFAKNNNAETKNASFYRSEALTMFKLADFSDNLWSQCQLKSQVGLSTKGLKSILKKGSKYLWEYE